MVIYFYELTKLQCDYYQTHKNTYKLETRIIIQIYCALMNEKDALQASNYMRCV